MKLREEEIQTLFFTGYGGLAGTRVLLLRAVEGGDARAALARVPVQFGRGRVSEAVQLALTPRGLARLELAPDALHSFPADFLEPVEDPHRLRALGDRGANAPEHWSFSGDAVDAALFLFAADEAAVEDLDRRLTAELETAYEVTSRLAGQVLDEHKEHFGFRDGLSQPRVRELRPWAAPEDAVAAGELLLGYPDETGDEPPSPRDGNVDLGRDGTFLVLRQLEQDVAGFWGALRERTESDEHALWLASKLLGRWPDGTPATPEGPGPQPRTAPYEASQFARDPHGLAVPKGAHVRRANPRDALLRDPRASLAKVARHRILRRGRPYGAPAPASVYPNGLRVSAPGVESTGPGDARGLLFVCLCADIARQFELVQQTWLNNAKHDGLFDEVCPVAAGRDLRVDSRNYTLPQTPLRRRVHALPHFVTVKGSAYFFLPGRSALRHLLEP